MYKQNRMQDTSIDIENTILGESIEDKMERIINNKEGIKDGAPLIYTERKDGIQAGYNIRTDRFEVALDAMNTIDKSNKAKREEKGKVIQMDGDQTTQGEDNKSNQ